MSARHTPNANVWWCDAKYSGGLIGYIGRSNDGPEFARHSHVCQPGYWCVSLTGWVVAAAHAVVDDFGNLVQVTPR